MNKLEQKHLEIIEDCFDYGGHVETDKVSIKSAELTEEIAIKFHYWIFNEVMYSDWDGLSLKSKYSKLIDNELFDEFLKTL